MREVSPRSLDAVAAIGEILSSRIVAAALAASGIAAPHGSIRGSLIVTDEQLHAGGRRSPRPSRA